MDVLLSPVADLARTDLSLDIAASPVPAPPPPAAQGQAAEPGHSRMIIEERDGRYIYKIYDPRTGEVLRQVPREELLRHREALQEAAERLQSGQSPVSQLGAVIV